MKKAESHNQCRKLKQRHLFRYWSALWKNI